MTFAHDWELHEGVLQLEIESGETSPRRATAWLASDSGHLISCAHIFWDLADKKLQSARVRWRDNDWILTDILEIGDQALGLDYSILKIPEDKIPKMAKVLKISTGSTKIRRKRTIIGCGFPHAPGLPQIKNYDGTTVTWNGTASPGDSNFDKLPHFRISCSDHSTPDGLSGGPIFFEKSADVPIVIGLQRKAEGNQVRYALPIEALKVSVHFREIITRQYPFLKLSFIEKLTVMPPKVGSSSRGVEPKVQFGLALHDSKSFPLGAKALLQQKVVTSNATCARNLGLLLNVKARKAVELISFAVDCDTIFQGDDISMEKLVSRGDFTVGKDKRLRLIVDLTGTTNGSVSETSMAGHSHLVTLTFSSAETERQILGNSPALQVFETFTNTDVSIDSICALFHDVAIDSGVFYNIKLLPAFYATQEQRQMLSVEKARFLKTLPGQSKLYGVVADFESLPYVPFCGVARDQLNGHFNIATVRKLWIDFLWHLFRPRIADQEDLLNYQVSDSTDLLELIGHHWPKRKGQISDTRILAAINRCPTSLISLRFLVICERSVRGNGKVAASMRRVFRKTVPPKPGHLVVINPIEVLGLAGLRDCVGILPFDFRPKVAKQDANNAEGVKP